MATTHVFIVNSTTFNIHLKYMFAGTGAKDLSADILLSEKDAINKNERLLAGLAADAARIRPGDYILFYLQQNKQKNIKEGQLFGIFQAKARAFIDPGGKALKKELGKKLTFRVRIKPYKVYAKGISEWDLLDNIEDIKTPKEMIWSLIYRKLRGNRGNTMVTLSESKRIFRLLGQKNSQKVLKGNGFCWDMLQKQIKSDKLLDYPNISKALDVQPRIITQYVDSKRSFENLLQAFIVGNIEKLFQKTLFKGQTVDWLGNEVTCGVGRQRIDILVQTHDKQKNLFIYPIELKDEQITSDIFPQLTRYIDWINLYYQTAKTPTIVPVIIAAAPKKRKGKNYPKDSEFQQFNKLQKVNCAQLEYITFNKMLKFSEEQTGS